MFKPGVKLNLQRFAELELPGEELEDEFESKPPAAVVVETKPAETTLEGAAWENVVELIKTQNANINAKLGEVNPALEEIRAAVASVKAAAAKCEESCAQMCEMQTPLTPEEAGIESETPALETPAVKKSSLPWKKGR